MRKSNPKSGPKAGIAAAAPSLDGVEVVRLRAATLPGMPGVYRMVGADGRVLYVGKAKNLKKRVITYTQPGRLGPRLQKMVGETHDMEFVTTHTETDALLLEANLIKQLRPRYNILLRDDKSFPEIRFSGEHAFPQVLKHRGSRSRTGSYFGPFASVWAVNETLATLQRAFLLRTCTDAVFGGRTRPCLLYQIKRCSAPCVGKISEADYALLADQAREFLEGKSQKIQKRLAAEMQGASEAEDFEQAAGLRDRIRALTRVQGEGAINPGTVVEADIVALHLEGGRACVQVFFIRGGRNFGNRAFYPTQTAGAEAPRVLSAFLGQFYARHPAPREVLMSHRPDEATIIAEALSVGAGRKVKLTAPQRGDRARLVAHAVENARGALARKAAENATQEKMLGQLARLLKLEQQPRRIEVYDNSHISGTKAVGAMVVAGSDGFRKNAYRKFNIKNAPASGDDYAMMREVLERRFKRALREDVDGRDNAKDGGADWPDLVILDGGKGQLGIALAVFAELGIGASVPIIAISKGPNRNAGRERIHLPGKKTPIELAARDPLLYFLQRLRDEAHRFAIGTHRAKRAQATTRSALDTIPGIGGVRKKALLHHFGSAAAIAEAGVGDLAQVDGISRATAGRIYDWFHSDG